MISVRKLSKCHKARSLLRDLDLEVETGGRVAILGPTGCGKTTLLRLIAGFEVPDQGEIWLEHQLVSGPNVHRSPRKRGVAMVFQSLALWPHMKIRDNLLFCTNSSSSKSEQRERVARFSAMMDIENLLEAYPSRLSGGECQRVALARALIMGRKTLLLDEPLSSFDSDLRELVVARLVDYFDESQPTLIIVTHHFDEISGLARRAYRFAHGRLSEVPGGPFVASSPKTDGEASL